MLEVDRGGPEERAAHTAGVGKLVRLVDSTSEVFDWIAWKAYLGHLLRM